MVQRMNSAREENVLILFDKARGATDLNEEKKSPENGLVVRKNKMPVGTTVPTRRIGQKENFRRGSLHRLQDPRAPIPNTHNANESGNLILCARSFHHLGPSRPSLRPRACFFLLFFLRRRMTRPPRVQLTFTNGPSVREPGEEALSTHVRREIGSANVQQENGPRTTCRRPFGWLGLGLTSTPRP